MDYENAKAAWDAAVLEFWRRKHVGAWYLKPKQKTALEDLRTMDDPFFEASRRFGKTTTILAYCVEENMSNKGHIVRWCEPWKNQCREIVQTEMDQIQSFVPKEYRFTWHQVDSYYEFPTTGSKIYLRGINEDRGESARGTKANIIVADEFGNWKEPQYILDEVLGPQLLTTYGKLIIAGTPPRNLTHLFYQRKDRAKVKKHFIQRLIYDQELVDWAQVEKVIADAGGWESPGVRREYLCEKVMDKNYAIIPEWDDKYIQEVKPDEFFQFYNKYDGLDIGVRHMTVNLFAYYDFRKAKLMVMDEVGMMGAKMTTEKLAEEIRAKEAHYYGVKWEQLPDQSKRMRWRCIPPSSHFKLRRISDINLLLINDLSMLHGLHFDATDKGELEEMVNEVRIWVNSGKVIIDPRCTLLIDCLRYGVWDEHRKKWEESELLGHFDALAALMYLIRNVDKITNPIPSTYGKTEAEYFFVDTQQTKRDQIKKLLNIK